LNTFFWEDFSDSDIEDVIALMRRLPSDTRKQQLPLITMFLRMAEINLEMQNNEDVDKQREAIKEFYELFIPYYDSMKTMLNQLTLAKEKNESILSSLDLKSI